MPGCVFSTPNNAEEVSHALLLLMKDPLSADDLRREREPLLEKFSIAACAASYAKFYRSLYGGKVVQPGPQGALSKVTEIPPAQKDNGRTIDA
jgi:hypothetical protein